MAPPWEGPGPESHRYLRSELLLLITVVGKAIIWQLVVSPGVLLVAPQAVTNNQVISLNHS